MILFNWLVTDAISRVAKRVVAERFGPDKKIREDVSYFYLLLRLWI